MTEPLQVDARGEKCPMPVVLLARAVRGADPAREVLVQSDDPAAAHDIPAWCRMRRATLIAVDGPDDSGVSTYRIALAGEPRTGD
jgi:tRNA 2-thiouridine synthesizing protein A